MKKQWNLKNIDKNEITNLQQKYNINKLLAIVLYNRNIINEKDVELFLNPTRNDFYDPFLMPDMEKAVSRLLQAIDKKEKVIIYGDYDVDGITSTTVLKSFLEERGLIVDTYIPNRINEGYGLNNKAIDEIVQKEYSLIITVDCGISAVEEIQYANKKGIQTIITDHHEPGDVLPNAIAVVNAKRKDSIYPCRHLAGVGVVFKFIQAISQRLNLEEKEYLKYLDIVCVGTISDIVPLVDENRVIAKLGLMLVNQTKNLGLKSILNLVGYKKIDSNAISFGVAPRVNASGRMGHQEDALELFLSKNINRVSDLTNKLNEYNLKRQEIERKIYNDAIEQIEKNKLYDKNIIVVSGKNWHHGVIGIVSSKITELYFKPSILLCLEEDLGKGSGRSIPGFDLHQALSKCSDDLEKYGGHSMAVGITLKQENINKFKNNIEDLANKSNIEDITPIINIDAELTLQELSKEWVESLSVLEPFGEANKVPLFAIRNLKIDSIRAISEGKHLKLILKDSNTYINAIGFNMGSLAEDYKIGDKIDVVGILEINSFNGVESLQINLKDIMKSL